MMKILCELNSNWRNLIINAMQAAGIAGPQYSGKIEFTLNEGLILECQRWERITGKANFQENADMKKPHK